MSTCVDSEAKHKTYEEHASSSQHPKKVYEVEQEGTLTMQSSPFIMNETPQRSGISNNSVNNNRLFIDYINYHPCVK